MVIAGEQVGLDGAMGELHVNMNITWFELAEPPRSYPGGATLLRLRCLEAPPETVSEGNVRG